MAQITIMEASNLLNQLRERLTKLNFELSRNTTVNTIKGEQPELPSRTVENILSDIETVTEHIVTLKGILMTANQFHEFVFQGAHYTLTQALEKAKLERQILNKYETLAATAAKEIPRFGAGAQAIEVVATFNPEDYVSKAEEKKKFCEGLSSAIDRINYGNTVDVPFADKYMLV